MCEEEAVNYRQTNATDRQSTQERDRYPYDGETTGTYGDPLTQELSRDLSLR